MNRSSVLCSVPMLGIDVDCHLPRFRGLAANRIHSQSRAPAVLVSRGGMQYSVPMQATVGVTSVAALLWARDLMTSP
jgi:hypothetical protein